MATIKGNNSTNTLNGTSYADYIYGYGGNDTLNGNGGNDHLYGGDGIDRLNGGSGSDYLYGNGGNDLIYGDTGNDYLYGNDGSDTLHGGDGADRLDGGSGIDWLYGDTGNDLFWFSGYGDHYDGGSGTDTISFAKSTAGILLEAPGLSYSAPNSWTDNGGSVTSVEKIVGSNYADRITQSAVGLPVTVDGAGGNDRISLEAIDGFQGRMYGGSGNDHLYWEGREGAGLTIASGQSGDDTLDAHSMYGGSGHDTFILEAFYATPGNHVVGNNAGGVVRDFVHGEDFLQIVVPSGPVGLTHSGDVWTVHDSAGDFDFTVANVTDLGEGDFDYTNTVYFDHLG